MDLANSQHNNRKPDRLATTSYTTASLMDLIGPTVTTIRPMDCLKLFISQ